MQNVKQINGTTYRSFTLSCLIAFNISLSSFYFGYIAIYYAAIPSETINKIYHIPYDAATASGLLNGAISLGGLIGSCLSSILLDRFSRRNCLLFLDFCSIFVGLLIYIPNFYSFIILRTLQGVLVGAFSSISPIIIKQITPIQLSAIFGNFSQLGLTGGVLFGQLLSYILKKQTGDQSGQEFWIILFGIPLITQMIQIVVLIFVFPFETPKYLLLNNQNKPCEDLIHTLYKDQYFEQVYQQKICDISHDIDLTTSSVQAEPIQINKVIPLAAFVAAMLTSFQQLSGINAMVIYGSQMAEKSFTGQIVLLIPLLMNFIIVVFVCISFSFLYRFGRKALIVSGFFIAAIANASISLGYSKQGNTYSQVILAGIIIYMSAYGASLGPIGWAYLPEIMPPSAMPYIVACNWLTNGIITTFFPIITEHLLHGNPQKLFLFFTIISVFGAVLNWRYMIQTKGKTEKQIMNEYKNAKIC